MHHPLWATARRLPRHRPWVAATARESQIRLSCSPKSLLLAWIGIPPRQHQDQGFEQDREAAARPRPWRLRLPNAVALARSG